MAEIFWVENGKKHRTQAVQTIVSHDVIKEDEETPTVFPDPTLWLPAPLVLEDAPLSYGLTVSGTLTTDGSTPAVFPDLVDAGLENGKTRFADGLGSPSYEAKWNSSLVRWEASVVGTTGIWYGYEDVDSPEDVVEWVANPPATGIPVFAATGTTAQLGQDAIVDASSVFKCIRVAPVLWVQIYPPAL
jgi:hypothetical protein